MENSTAELDVDKERELLKMLSFLQTNEEKMYIREASMLVYGTSKYFENNRRDAICNILRMEQGEAAAGDEIADEILQQYHVFPVEQEICIKGNFTIVFEETTLETKGISGGISLSSKDIAGIKNIVVHTERIMTIENKTAFCRFEQENCSTIYLEGYANRSQIAFLKKLVENNPDKCYFHFGDIDAGGFLIHRNLCEATGQTFEMFHMGVPELKDERYKKCLAPLTANDKVRLQTLKDNEVYGECVQEMLHLNAKLEQEIVCYFLMKDK